MRVDLVRLEETYFGGRTRFDAVFMTRTDNPIAPRTKVTFENVESADLLDLVRRFRGFYVDVTPTLERSIDAQDEN
jgi:hypothetical protein